MSVERFPDQSDAFAEADGGAAFNLRTKSYRSAGVDEAGGGAQPELSGHLPTRVRSKILHGMLSRYAPIFSLATILVAAVLFFMLYGHSEMPALLGWFGAMVASVGLRLVIWQSWIRQPKKLANADLIRWGKINNLSALGEGLCWAFVIWFVRVENPLLDYAVAMVAGGVAISSYTAYGMSRSAFLAFILPILFAQVLEFTLRPLPFGHAMALIWILFSIIVVVFQHVGASQFRTNLRHRLVQEALAAEQRTLLETMPLGVLVTRNGVVQDCNQALLQMFGYQYSELVGRSARILMLTDDEFQENGGRADVIRGGPPVDGHARRRHHDGHALDVEIHIGLTDSQDQGAPVVAIYDDIGERLKIEHELRFSRDRLRLALDALQSGVWDCDVREKRFFFSHRLKAIVGLPEGAQLGPESNRLFFYHDWVHPDDAAQVADLRMSCLLSGDLLDVQYRLVCNGQIVWVRESVQVQKDFAGRLVRFTGSLTDTTAINTVQEQLRVSESLYRSLIEASGSLIWRCDSDLILQFVNERAALGMYGYLPVELVGHHINDFNDPEFADLGASSSFQPVLRGIAVNNVEAVHLHKSGRRVYVSINAVPLFDDKGDFSGIIGINTDITYLKKRERAFQDSIRMQRMIFDAAGEGIVMIRNGRILRANRAFIDLVGGTLGEVVARPLAQWFADPEEWEEVASQLQSLRHVIKVEQQLVQSDGRRLWVSVTGRSAEFAEEGECYIWVLADISERRAREEQSWFSANHDELTGLPNRRLLHDRFEQALTRARREGGNLAVLVLDLDGFKQINDSYGHRCGDVVLKVISQRIADQVRQADTVARLGGDEFIVLLNQVASALDMEAMAQRLVNVISQPVDVDGQTLTLGVSIGVSLFPQSGDSISALQHAADMAMYAAKASGTNRWQVAPPSQRGARSKSAS